MTDDSSQFYLFCSFNYSTSFTCSVNCPWCFYATCLCSTICSFSCFIGCLVNEFITYLKCLLGSVDMCIVHAKNFELPFLVILLLARCVPCVSFSFFNAPEFEQKLMSFSSALWFARPKLNSIVGQMCCNLSVDILCMLRTLSCHSW